MGQFWFLFLLASGHSRWGLFLITGYEKSVKCLYFLLVQLTEALACAHRSRTSNAEASRCMICHTRISLQKAHPTNGNIHTRRHLSLPHSWTPIRNCQISVSQEQAPDKRFLSCLPTPPAKTLDRASAIAVCTCKISKYLNVAQRKAKNFSTRCKTVAISSSEHDYRHRSSWI